MRKILSITLLLLLVACNPLQIQEEHIMSVEIRSQLGDVLLSGNPIWVDVDNGNSIPSGATNYKILLRIVSTDSALVGSPFVMECQPNTSGIASFNIKAYVNQPATYTFEHPQNNKAIAHPLLAYDITLEPGEEYTDSNGALQIIWSGTTESHRILKGGLSHTTQAENNMRPGEFYDTWIDNGGGTKFLTWQPNNTFISPTQPVKLWYIWPASASKTLDMQYFITYENGDIVEKTETITLDPDKLYEFNLSPVLWNVEIDREVAGVNYKPLFIDFSLEDSSDFRYSEIRRFFFDTKYYEQNNYIYFKTSLAGIDCIWFTGEKTEIFNTSRNTATKQYPTASTALTTPTEIVTSVTGTRSWQINTGYKNKTEMAALRDFAISNQIWLANNNNAIPVKLDDKEKVLADIARNLDELTITLTEAHNENYY